MEVKEQKVRIGMEDMPPGLYANMQNIEKYLKTCGLSHSLVHLVKIRASQINRCGYCLDMHHKDALRAGEKLERLYLLPAWQESPCFSDAEKAVLHLTEILTQLSLHSPLIIEKAYEEMTQFYSVEEIANIVMAISQINSWNRLTITAGTIPGTYNPQTR